MNAIESLRAYLTEFDPVYFSEARFGYMNYDNLIVAKRAVEKYLEENPTQKDK